MDQDRERLRADAVQILQSAVAAADPRAAVLRALSLESGVLRAGDAAIRLDEVDRVFVIGAGKAAAAMAAAVSEVLDGRVAAGTVVVPHGGAGARTGLDVWEAAHPLPDTHSIAAAAEALRLAGVAAERDLVVCVLSGGASALWTAPAAGVHLGDVRRVTGALLRSGASIGEVNTVRRHLSRIGGGRLAAATCPARLLTLVVSDVVGSPLDVVASGPTVPDPTTYADALDVLARREVAAPPAVVRHLQAGAAGAIPDGPPPGDRAFARATTVVVADNADALIGAGGEAERLGYRVRVARRPLEGEAREAVARIVAAAARDARSDAGPAALLWGGETTVSVRGGGTGGRNQELALAAAVLMDGGSGTVLAALGTDGVDGPTDAAGAIVDGGTVGRAAHAGIDARAALRDNDSHPCLRSAGDLLVSGATGTNVNDVVLVLRAPSRGARAEDGRSGG
jgi:glycerate 2-kinase